MALANTWAGDKVEEGRTFETDAAFWQAVANKVTPRAAATGPARRPRWDILKDAVETDGTVTDVPWRTFMPEEQTALLTELEACPVQVASGGGTSTACHGNKHGKLPKRVPQVNGKDLDQLPPSQQVDNTPYFEFLVAGGQKKKSGIERGILDEADGLVYLTAHYDVGSIVVLSGVPGSLVANWRAKVVAYRKLHKGQ